MLNRLNLDILIEMIRIGGWIPYHILENSFPDMKINLTSLLEIMEQKQILIFRDSRRVICPNCTNKINCESFGDYLICKECNATFDLQNLKIRLKFATFSLSKQGTSDFISNALKLIVSTNGSTEITAVWEIGRTSSKNLSVFLSIGSITKEKILALYGLIHYKEKPGILLHCNGLQDESKRILEDYPQELLIPIMLDTNLGNVKNSINKIDEAFTNLSKRCDLVVALLDEGGEITAKYPRLEEGWLDKLKILSLSINGGYKFEEPALSLLWTLGIPIILKGRKDIAEGALIHPHGFWLLDAKSCMKPYNFQQSEKDKISRYVRKLEDSKKDYPTFSSEGIGIITRDITKETVENIRKFFDEYLVNGIIFIGLVPPLIKLLEYAQHNPEYWFRFNPKSHPKMLFHGTSKLKEEWKNMKERWNLHDSNLIIIDEKLVANYYNIVKKTPTTPNPLLGDLKSVSQTILSLFDIY
ncbi:MAG: hypothetical protein ACFE9L_21085 [Candidatus Hodarchaeota archaeon]